MSLEFVWIYSPENEINTDWFGAQENFHGSLINEPQKKVMSFWGGNDQVFLLSNKNIGDSPNSFFDGNFVYNQKFGLDFSPQDIDEYFDFIYNARGTFSLAFSHEEGGVNIARFSNDPLGMYPLLYWTDGINIIVTNNPILSETIAKLALGIKLTRSFTNVLNEVIAFTPLDQGPFEGMELLPFDSELIIDSQGELNIKRRHGDDFFYRAQDSEEELLDQAIQELTENVIGIANAPQKIKIADITGGFDSRLVLALILKAQVKDKFYFNTNGDYPNPDANVANYIINKYKLKKIDLLSIPYKRKGQISIDVLYELTSFAYVSSGMKNNIDRHLSTLHTTNDILGVGGGYSAYKANKSKSLLEKGGIQEAVELICSGNFSLPEDMILKTKEKVERIIRKWVIHQGMSIYDALDRFHIEHRTRFHIGLCEHWSRICQPKMHPLQSPALVRLAFKSGYESRIADKLLFNLMEKLDPSLCLVPFENKVWKEQAYQDSSLQKKIANVEAITFKSNKLYAIDPCKEMIVFESDLPDEHQALHLSEQSKVSGITLKNIDKSWEREQRKLGRKWHWYKLGEIKGAFDYLLSKSLIEDTQFIWMDDLKKKELKDFKNIKEVIELHVLTNFLIFHQKKEIPLRVSYKESSELRF